MKKFFVIVCLLFTSLHSQIRMPDKVYAGVGAAVPANPDYFYDYWKTGYGVQFIGTYVSQNTFDPMITAEGYWFGFDDRRYFQRFNADPSQSTFEGGNAVVISVSGTERYRIPGYETSVPYFFAGIGLTFSDIGKATMTYPFSSVTKGSQPSVGAVIPLGVCIETKYKNSTDIIITLKYSYGIPTSKTILSGFTSLSLGLKPF